MSAEAMHDGKSRDPCKVAVAHAVFIGEGGGAVDDVSRREFTAFVVQRSHVLLRAAYALTGDQHAAEDLLQNALAKAALRWKSIRTSEEAYVRRVLYRDFISAWRWRRRRPEQLHGDLPEWRGQEDHALAVTQRVTLYDAIGKLPPKQRAVLVLRYLEDLSEKQVAEVLGCSTGTVASQASRALAKLREDLMTQEGLSGQIREVLTL